MFGESLGLVERAEGFVQLRDAATDGNDASSCSAAAAGGGGCGGDGGGGGAGDFLLNFLQQDPPPVTPPPSSSSSSSSLSSSRFFLQTPLIIPNSSSSSNQQPLPFFIGQQQQSPNSNNNREFFSSNNIKQRHSTLFEMDLPNTTTTMDISNSNNNVSLSGPTPAAINDTNNNTTTTGLGEQVIYQTGEDVKMEASAVECPSTSTSASVMVVSSVIPIPQPPPSTILGNFKDRGEAFVERLKSIGGGGAGQIVGLPSSEEFSQFERMFYSQLEEVRMLKEKFSCARLAVLQLEEEKRSLEMKLVRERAERESERRNAQAELEKSKMTAENAAYGIKAEVDTWKRKTEAAQQELKWLKEQLRTLEMEKIDALRRLGEVKEKSESAAHYGAAIESYAARQKEVMAENIKALMGLEQARDMLGKIVEANGLRMKALATHLRLENKARKTAEAKTEKVEADLISVRANLVQERGELHRSQTAEIRKTELLKKVISENSTLHNGIEMLLHSFEGKLDSDSEDFIQHVQQIRKDIQSTISRIK